MHGRVCEGRRHKSRRQHMLISSSRVIASVEGGASSSSFSQSSSTSFSKDGRKISVGDCALFKPPQDCPPFIGIIRLIITEKDNKLKLGVNWLYRPTELKLGKGILLEAEPNELFYSFHEDNIPAASLLHPCKVAFLPRGVELPSGICSFVCRRVYDVTNERLWWLTDQDYIDDRQLEVDKLLCKTRSEMHTTLQQGGRSPKSMNSPTTSQAKDGIQNNNSFLSQGKGRKRERMDHGSESVKRERSTRIDDSGSAPLRTESSLKSEISKFTEKGGLVDSDGVEKLVQLMLPERNEKKIDLVCRAILAGVVAATDKFDCLSRFVQLRGLPVFDEWLQEVHKGKVGDGGSPKDGDRSVDDFLLVLLRALDKLPVNLNALQTCNIGKSVNHLRSHKNSEIGKKARSLVDTWKKRVEAEMDAKSGSNQGVSWPGRLTHGGRHSGGSAEANKTSSSQLHASKSVSIKVENNLKPLATSPGSTRSAPSPGSGGTVSKDGQQRNAGAGGVSENLAVVKDEKSSSSSQSHNNSQSCSSEHAKTGNLSGKEDARSSTAGSTVKKCSSRHRKSNNVFQGSASSSSPREAGLSRSFSSQRNTPSEKISQSSLTSEKTLEVPLTEGCSNKLIVKLPKRGRSPAQSVSGGSFEDHAPVNSRASSPVHLVKQELCDNNVREKVHSSRANASSVLNAESWQSNEFKDIMTGSHEAAGSPLVVAGDEHSRALKDSGKAAVNVKGTSSSPGNEFKSGERHGGTLSSMNALIESCVRYSETNASLAGSDDIGMNLLASVAADEMSKSPVASPSVSQPSNSLMNENSTGGNNTKLIASDALPREKHQAATQDRTTCSNEQGEQHVSSSGMQLGDSEIKNDSKTGDLDQSSNSDTEDLQRLVDQRLESNDNSECVVASPALPTTAVKEKSLDDNELGEVNERKVDVKSEADCISDSTKRIATPMPTECRAIVISRNVDSMPVEHSPSDGVAEIKKEELPPAALRSELVKKIGEDVSVSSGISRAMDAVTIDRVVTEKVDNMAVNHIDQKDKNKVKQECDASVAVGKDASAGLNSSVTKGKVEPVEGNLENTGVKERYSGPRANPGVSSPKDAEDLKRPNGLKASDADGDEAEECTSAARDTSSASAAASAGSEMDARVEFDLNEGFDGDDAKHGDSNNFSGSVFLTPTPLQPVNTLPFPAAPVSSGLPASITVAAAAKGPFVPPEDLLRNKGAVGWRGSAATSAFRPAEPRKAQDVLLSTNNASTSDASTSAGKQTRTFLDFDLNVPDERLLEDLPSQRSGNATNSTPVVTNSFDQVRSGFMGSALDHSSGGLDLDLNKVDDSTDMNNYPMSSSHRLDSSFHQVKLSSPGGRRDFDLNDGPAGDDGAVEPSMVLSQQSRSGLLPSQPSLSGIRVNGENMASFSTWFPAANAYSAVSIPPIMPDRGDQPFPMIANRGQQRMLGPTTSVSSFTPEGYRGPVLSSSPAMPFQSTTFQYPVFPFGNSFPIASANFSGASTAHMDSSSSGRACFPGVNSQILGAGVTVPANYPRPYIVGLPNGGSNGGVLDNSAKWFRSSGLDLNSGPGGHETDGRDESTHVPRQLSSSASLPLKEDQARMYQMSGGVLKRKEPEGGWDGYRQSSWQ